MPKDNQTTSNQFWVWKPWKMSYRLSLIGKCYRTVLNWLADSANSSITSIAPTIQTASTHHHSILSIFWSKLSKNPFPICPHSILQLYSSLINTQCELCVNLYIRASYPNICNFWGSRWNPRQKGRPKNGLIITGWWWIFQCFSLFWQNALFRKLLKTEAWCQNSLNLSRASEHL